MQPQRAPRDLVLVSPFWISSLREFDIVQKRGALYLSLFVFLTIYVLVQDLHRMVVPSAWERGSHVCVCITLPEASERRRNFHKLAAFLPNSTPVDYLYAVDGGDPRQRLSILQTPLENLPPLCFSDDKDKYDREYYAVLGCTLSHLKAIREAYLRRVEWALIFEDDVVHDLAPYWEHRLADFVDILPAGWFIAQLSLIGTDEMWADLIMLWTSDGRFPPYWPTTTFWSTGAYLISKSAIARVMELYSTALGKFDLKGLPCINADVHLLKDAAPLGTYFVATPPLFTCAEDGLSYIHNQSERVSVHLLSRKYSLDWSARAARVRRPKTHAIY
jgi:GR25 family glycosyltransferase involved in LPS biosynthesis